MSLVSVLVVTWNSEATIESCLASVPPWVEVVLVDNASSDETVTVVRQAFSRVTVIESPLNLGFGAACNLAAQQARGEYYLLLNPDAALHPGAIEAMVDYMAAMPECGVVGPCIKDAEGGLELSWDRWITPVHEWVRRGRYSGKRQMVALAEPTRVDWISGACMLLRAEAWRQVGGFDTEYFLYFEDADLCRRLTNEGWSVHYDPRAVVTHLRGKSSGQNASQVEVWYRMGQLRYYSRHNSIFARVLLRFYLVAKYARRALRGDCYARRILVLALGVVGCVRVT